MRVLIIGAPLAGKTAALMERGGVVRTGKTAPLAGKTAALTALMERGGVVRESAQKIEKVNAASEPTTYGALHNPPRDHV